MDYNPTTLNQRLVEAGQALSDELAKDASVQEAQANLEKAKSWLRDAEEKKAGMPYPGVASKHALAQWHKAVSDVQFYKVQVSEAEKGFRSAQNDVAASRYGRRLQAQEAERAQRRETEQAHRSMIEEETARSRAEANWLLAGGTKETFATAWPALWSKELERRVQATEEQSNRSAANRVRAAF